MMGFGQDEGGRCQGLEWNLSQTEKEVTSGWGDEEGEKVATGQRPSQHPAHWGTSCPGRGSQQAHHSDSGRAAKPERASRNRRHLHLHSQEQGRRGREWASVRICLLGSPSPTRTPTASPLSCLQSPAYTLVWTRLHNGKLPARAMDFNGILTIRSVQPSDAGTYVCTGSNMFAMDQGTATLHVQGTLFVSMPDPPSPDLPPHPPRPVTISSFSGQFLNYSMAGPGLDSEETGVGGDKQELCPPALPVL